MKKTTLRHPAFFPTRARGFTLIELLIGSAVMLIVVVAALQIYSRSNKISADQQQFIEIQTDIRAAMYFVSRDARMIGIGLTESLMGYALDGVDNESTGTSETPDRLKILGNMEDPLILMISSYHGSSVDVKMEDYALEKQPYPDSFYVGKIALIVPNAGSACVGAAVRMISHVTHNADGTNESVNLSPGQAPGINPPGGLSDVCAAEDFVGGALMFCDMREYWLDVTGNVSGLTAGVNGYIGGGQGGILYMTLNSVHYPIAQNIETIQFQYNGDFDADSQGLLDGFTNWNSSWTRAQIGRIRQIRIQILGRTLNPFASVGHKTGTQTGLYMRPAVANTSAASTPDWRKRFLLESTANLRNLSVNLFNTGLR
jgi:prepilin-type N-terminal cleavage/methylation domain-containing protein